MRAYLVLALCAASTCAWAQEAPLQPNLHIDSVPSGAMAVVLPAGRPGNGFQCVTPCDAFLNRKVAVQIMAIKEGYDMPPQNLGLKWVKRDKAWRLEPDRIVIQLVKKDQKVTVNSDAASLVAK